MNLSIYTTQLAASPADTAQPLHPPIGGKTYNMKVVILGALVCLVSMVSVMVSTLAAFADTYQIVSSQTDMVDGLQVTQTIVQYGENSLNQFTMHHVLDPTVPSEDIIGPLVLLPGLANSFQMFEFHENGKYKKSFAGFFAKKGFAVWGFSPRETGIASGACAMGLDCSVMADWGLQSVVDDVTFIRSQIELAYPGQKPAIIGQSYGAIAGLALVNAHPNDHAGLVAWEGTLHTADPTVQAFNQTLCIQFQALLAGGVFIDDQGPAGVKFLAFLAETDPNSPTPLPGFPPGTTNHQALVFALSTPTPNPAPFPDPPTGRPGFVTVAGDPFQDLFFFASEERLFANLAVFNDGVAIMSSVDLNCSLAGDTTFSSNLGTYTAPTLIIKAALGAGPLMSELPTVLGSDHITIISESDFGHVDHLMSPDHKDILEQPIRHWLKDTVFID